MKTLDIDFVRSQFPAFSEPTLKGVAHFENAGGAYACKQVIERLDRYYRQTKVQPYYGFKASKLAGQQMDQARERMAQWLNVDTDEINFGPSTTQNTYVVAQAFRQHLQPGDEVIVTNQDHEANIGCWRRLEEAGVVVHEWQVDPETAELASAGLDALLNERTKVVAFTHCSNIVASINPVREWTDKVHAVGAIAIVDGVAYAGHGLPDVDALGADIYLFSLYKVYGPHLGVMVMRKQVNEMLPNQAHFFKADHSTARFTPAGPDHAQIASVNGVIDYFEAVYDHHFPNEDVAAHKKAAALLELFHQAEHDNLKMLLDYLGSKPGVKIIGKKQIDRRAPTVAIVVEGKTPAELAEALAALNICVGNGHCYAYRLTQALAIEPGRGVLRLSFLHYTSREEIQQLIDALESVL
jgi:cysteine desulfurase family protein (TIGR01976 family)